MNNNQGRRRTRRVRQQRKQQKTQIGRILLTVGLMALIAVVSIGGTIAWLTATTGAVTNTFSTSNVALTLTESKLNDTANYNYANDADYTADQSNVTNVYKIIPGKVYKKDPKVTVTNDLPVYLFVNFVEEENPSAYFTYSSTLTAGNGWYQANEENDSEDKIPDTVWFRTVGANDEVKSWNLLDKYEGTVEGLTLENGYILVNDSVKVGDMTNAQKAKLVYTAYAIQQEGFADAAAAWEKVSTSGN